MCISALHVRVCTMWVLVLEEVVNLHVGLGIEPGSFVASALSH